MSSRSVGLPSVTYIRFTSSLLSLPYTDPFHCGGNRWGGGSRYQWPHPCRRAACWPDRLSIWCWAGTASFQEESTGGSPWRDFHWTSSSTVHQWDWGKKKSTEVKHSFPSQAVYSSGGKKMLSCAHCFPLQQMPTPLFQPSLSLVKGFFDSRGHCEHPEILASV